MPIAIKIFKAYRISSIAFYFIRNLVYSGSVVVPISQSLASRQVNAIFAIIDSVFNGSANCNVIPVFFEWGIRNAILHFLQFF